MNRLLFLFLLLPVCFAGCKKTNDVPAEIRAQLAADNVIITNYLTKNNIKASAVDSAGIATGIYYVIDTLGTGADLFTSSTLITVGYTGKLLTTGAEFSSTDSFHPAYTLGATLRGWQLGVPQVKKGGVITLYLPSHYAYGPYAQPTLNLPANAILIFTIKLYNVTN